MDDSGRSIKCRIVSYEVIADALRDIVNSIKFDNENKAQASALYKNMFFYLSFCILDFL